MEGEGTNLSQVPNAVVDSWSWGGSNYHDKISWVNVEVPRFML